MPQQFNPTITFGSFAAFDDSARLLHLMHSGAYIPYDAIVEYDLVEERGKMGRTGVGRAFSVVFSGEYIATSLSVRLIVTGEARNEFTIPIIITPVKSSTFIYRNLKACAQNIIEKLDELCLTPPSEAQQSDPGYIEELRQLKLLRDEGVITEDEFQAKKKQLLGL